MIEGSAERISVSKVLERYKPQIGFWLGAAGLAGLMLLGASQCYQRMIDQEVSDWASKMGDKLNDPANLLAGEKFYPKVRVVPAGRTLEEALEMERTNPWVNVRNHPGTEFNSPLIAGFETRVIGKISIGSDIYNVIYTRDWGVAKCDDIQGLVLTDPTKKPEICAIIGDHILAQK